MSAEKASKETAHMLGLQSGDPLVDRDYLTDQGRIVKTTKRIIGLTTIDTSLRCLIGRASAVQCYHLPLRRQVTRSHEKAGGVGALLFFTTPDDVRGAAKSNLQLAESINNWVQLAGGHGCGGSEGAPRLFGSERPVFGAESEILPRAKRCFTATDRGEVG